MPACCMCVQKGAKGFPYPYIHACWGQIPIQVPGTLPDPSNYCLLETSQFGLDSSYYGKICSGTRGVGRYCNHLFTEFSPPIP